jgi:adenylyl- and sulfurtransferase ThiI
MQLVIKFFPEINLKSRSIHRRMSLMLHDNVRHILQRFDPNPPKLRILLLNNVKIQIKA